MKRQKKVRRLGRPPSDQISCVTGNDHCLSLGSGPTATAGSFCWSGSYHETPECEYSVLHTAMAGPVVWSTPREKKVWDPWRAGGECVYAQVLGVPSAATRSPGERIKDWGTEHTAMI